MNSWLIFALLAPVFWAFGNTMDSALRKHFVKNDQALTWWLSITRIPFIIILTLVFGFEIPSKTAVVWILFGGVLWMAPFVLYYMAMEFEEASRIALMLLSVDIFTVILAFVMIGEKLGGLEFIAFAFILLGGIFAAFKRVESKWHFSKAFWLIGLASLIWALADILFKKFTISFSGFWQAFNLYLIGGLLPGLFMIVLPKKRKEIFSHFRGLDMRSWILLTINQLIAIIGTIMFAYALTIGKASLTAVILGIQPLFVILWTCVLSRMIPEVEMENFKKENLILKGASLLFIIAGLWFLG